MEIDIRANADALKSLGISEPDFDAALETALDLLAAIPPADLPAPDNIPIWVRGRKHHLGDLARIEVMLS